MAEASLSMWPVSRTTRLHSPRIAPACERWPGTPITLRQGARVIETSSSIEASISSPTNSERALFVRTWPRPRHSVEALPVHDDVEFLVDDPPSSGPADRKRPATAA
jgi:hypothetical protein